MTEQAPNYLRDAFYRMSLIREFEDQAMGLMRGDNPLIAGSLHPCGGQEAIPVAALAALRKDDRVLATYRGHGWALEAGISPDALMAELMHRSAGVNGGRAGSLLASAPDDRFVGENSIVGAGGPLACGVGLAAKVQGEGRVVIVSFGDGAVSQGGLHEAFVTAGALKLPVIFMCENNGWAEMTPSTFTVTEGSLPARARTYGMAGVAVDGCDVEAVFDAVSTAAERARNGEGPTLIEARAPRLWGHYHKDVEHYRSGADRRAAAAQDPIARLRKVLEDGGTAATDIQHLVEQASATVKRAIEQAIASPPPALATLTDHVFGTGPKALTVTPAETSTMTYMQAVNRALSDELEARPDVVLFGEDVAKPGGVFGLTRGLQKKFGDTRVFDTPIAETAILGTAVGAAMQGLRPIADIMFADFMFVAFDQIINQAANIRYVTNGRASAPLVIRTQQGVTPGSCAQHGQSIEAFLAHVPGIKVGLPATPQDAYSMMRAAVADPDPCVILETRGAYPRSDEVTVGGDVEAAAGARTLREGQDLTIITWGAATYVALDAAKELEERGISASVLNVRWLAPLDEEAIARAVHNTGRVLIVHEAVKTGGFGAEIAARIAENHAQALRAPIVRIGSLDIPMPAAPALQSQVIPTVARVVDAAVALAGRSNTCPSVDPAQRKSALVTD
jgi:2-oxoisovalerate dehydrogenase E1 component